MASKATVPSAIAHYDANPWLNYTATIEYAAQVIIIPTNGSVTTTATASQHIDLA